MMKKENLSKKGTAHIDKSVWGDVSDDCKVTNFKLWENYGKKRIYVTDYQGRKICYIDCNNNNEVVAIEDNSKVITNAIEICAEFIEKFNF